MAENDRTTTKRPLLLTPIAGGWRVRTVRTCHIDILRMAYGNLRLVLSDLGDTGYGRAWCYQGPLVVVLAHALDFDPDAGEEPSGWVKEVGTERRACAAYISSQLRAHRGYVPDCPDCGNEALA